MITYVTRDDKPLRLCRKGLLGFVYNTTSYVFVPYREEPKRGVLFWHNGYQYDRQCDYPASVAHDYCKENRWNDAVKNILGPDECRSLVDKIIATEVIRAR